VAWLSAFEHDPACEEAAGALMRRYLEQGRRELAARTYERCAAALEELGLRTSPSLDELHAAVTQVASPATGQATATAGPERARREELGEELREELRPVSVLFAELTTGARLASKLDPETLRSVVGSSLAAVIAEVEALGGRVTSVSGRGLQAVFGAPEAHEDDPERAVRAAYRALAAVAAIADGEAPEEAALRIGVETGPAVVGPIGGGGKVEYGALGAVTGIAATLQSLARPGSALVGPATRAVTGHLFSWGADVELPGAGSRPLVAAYLERPRARTSQLRRASQERHAPLVGRDAELVALGRALRDAARGRGSVALLLGEPGLGKTRLVQECRHRLMAWVGAGSGRLPLWLEGRCASYTSTAPYSLYQHLVGSWIGVAPDQPDTAVRPALNRALTSLLGNAALGGVLGRMLGLPPRGLASEQALDRLSAQELQAETFGALRTVLDRLAATRRPAVVVLEDLHWADPTSLRFTAGLAEFTAARPLLVLATSRPDADQLSTLTRLPGVRAIKLGPLTASAERELATALIGSGADPAIIDAVLASTDGNPLFLEERLSSLLETGALTRDAGGWWLSADAGTAVPQVLDRLVRSRVDRLSPAAQDVVRTASVLGAEFPLWLLAAVRTPGAPPRGAPDPLLRAALDELQARDLIRQVAGPPDPGYRFRHALIQEATYGGLLRAQRRDLHGRAARAWEVRCAGREEETAAILGRHYAAAGEAERAFRYLELAGDHATAAFANDEAVSAYAEALGIADDRRDNDAGVRLRAKLANVLWRTARLAETRAAFEAALRLEGGNTLRRAHLLTRLGRLEMSDGRFDAAERALDAAQALLGDQPGDSDTEADQWLEMMIDARAGLNVMRSEYDRALATLEAARPVLAARGSPSRRYSFHQYLALQRVRRDRMRADERAVADFRRSLEAAEQSGDIKDIGYATDFLGWALLLRGDLAGARELLERARSIAERVGESVLLANSLASLVIAAMASRDTEMVRALAPRAIAAAETVGGASVTAYAKAPLAWLAWQDGRPGDVVKVADELTALLTTTQSGRYRWLYLFPLLAVRLADGDTGAAAEAARQMLAPSQQALPDELTAALDVACRAWDAGEADRAAEALRAALELAHELRYF
jgi:adenylate cyclase